MVLVCYIYTPYAPNYESKFSFSGCPKLRVTYPFPDEISGPDLMIGEVLFFTIDIIEVTIVLKMGESEIADLKIIIPPILKSRLQYSFLRRPNISIQFPFWDMLNVPNREFRFFSASSTLIC